jgi:hypothetical protein
MTRSRFARLVCAAVLTLVAALGSASPSLAVDPPDAAFVLPDGFACSGFDLGVEIRGSSQVSREFRDKNGNLVRTLSAGTGSELTFTNLSTNAQFVAKSNGSVLRSTHNPDGSRTEVATGHNVIILFPTDRPAGPSTTLYVGQVAYTVAPGEVFTLQAVSGTSTDICAALSG